LDLEGRILELGKINGNDEKVVSCSGVEKSKRRGLDVEFPFTNRMPICSSEHRSCILRKISRKISSYEGDAVASLSEDQGGSAANHC